MQVYTPNSKKPIRLAREAMGKSDSSVVIKKNRQNNTRALDERPESALRNSTALFVKETMCVQCCSVSPFKEEAEFVNRFGCLVVIAKKRIHTSAEQSKAI